MKLANLLRSMLALVLLVALVGVTADFQQPAPAHAQALVVTNLANSGAGSLRDAITQANAVAGASTITFAPGLSGTITLLPPTPPATTNRYAVTSPIVIEGDGRITLDGSNATQIFYLGTGADLTLNNMTLVNGFADFAATWTGGAIHLDAGALQLNNSTVANSISSGEAGGIYNAGISSVTIVNSTISGNTALGGNGGGILNFGALTIINSTLSGNSAPANAGGAVFNNGTLSITQTTVANNIAAAGGGIRAAGITNIAATVLSNNTGFNCVNYGAWNYNGYSFSDDATCGFGPSSGVALDLGPLAANGGPTLTHLLGSTSAALNAIANGDTVANVGASYTCNQTGEFLDTDQRGLPRPLGIGGGCDSGAVESADLGEISLNDVTLAEGNTGTTAFTFTLTRSGNITGASSVQVDTADNTATAGSGDYAPVTGQIVNFNPGDVTQTVTVNVNGDSIDEGASESFFVNLSNPTGATITDGQGNGVITDDDTAGFIVGLISGDTTEAVGTATFTIRLTSQPAGGADVTIPLTSDDLTEGTVPANVTISNANWNSGATVTVTGADDVITDGDIAYNILTGNPTSADPIYNAFGAGAVDNVAVTNLDDDVAGVTVSAMSGPTTEAGGTATFTVSLDAQPAGGADVTIPLSSSNTAEGTVPANVTVPNADWATGVTVTVTGVDDFVDDGDTAYTITTGDATSADPAFDALADADVDDVAVTNTDDDSAGINVSPTSGLVTTEAGGTATFTITLDSQPAGGADVTIPLTSSDTSEGSVPANVTVSNANWATGVTVTVTGVDDFVVDGDIAYTIATGDPTSADPVYNAYGTADVADVSATNTDDDSAGINVSPTSGIVTTEAGGTATFTITLDSQPAGGADVTIPLTSSDTSEGTVPANVTIANADWATGATVTVTGADDFMVDGDIAYTITTGDPASADPLYDAYGAADTDDVAVTNQDNDVAGVAVSLISGPTTEAGGTATFTVTLTSQPAGGADVTIPLTSSDPFEGTVGLSVTVLNADWNTGATVTVTGVDDLVDDGDIAYTIITGDPTSADPLYQALGAGDVANVAVTNTDDDTAGVTASAISGPTTEAGGTATFTLVLDSQPAGGADVTIPLTSLDTGEGTVAPASVTILNADWNVPVLVTVTGVDDFVVDGDVVYTIQTGTPVSGDPLYAALAVADVNVTNTDDDTSGITVSPTSGLVTTEAGGTATFTITLDSQPAGGADVTIPLTSSDTSEGSVPANVTIPNADWATGVTVTITGVDDFVDDGDTLYTIVTGDPTSTDPVYDAYGAADVADVSVTNTDDDTAGITVSPTSGLVTTEAGGTATFTITLDSQPAGGADVTIPLTSSDTSEGSVPANVVIANADWATGTTVTVTGVDDFVVDGDIAYTVLTGNPASPDPVYAAFSAVDVDDVAATNTDDDTVGITVSAISGPTTEAGGTATFTITLDSQPAGGADVTIPLTSSDTSEGAVPANVTIANADWATGATVTVTGVDDSIVDGDIAYTIVTGDPASADPLYNALGAADAADVSVTNQDDDVASVAVAPVAGLTTTEAGGTATFTISLTSQPAGGADVTVPLTSSDTSEGTVPANVTIPNADWLTGVTITVTGVDDAVDDGDMPYIIQTGDPTSADPLYNALGAADVSDVAVTNTDNDTAAIIVGGISGNTTEAGGTATFTITLGAQPAGGADVTIPLTSSDTSEGTVPASVTVLNANWATGATVTVTGVDDPTDDGDIAYTIVTGDPTSADAQYNAFGAADVADVGVTNIDNDAAGIAVSAISGSTDESGGTATFVVSLGSQPLAGADVTVPLSSSNTAEGTVPASVTVSNANWATGATVTVTGVDDMLVDGDITYTIITGDPTSADAQYNAFGAADVADVTVVNADNDSPPVANDDFYATNEDQTLTVGAPGGVLNGDTGGNGNPLEAVLNSTTSNGTLNYLNLDGSFEYVPNPGFFGSDTFTYYVTDGLNNSAPGTVTITVVVDNGTTHANDDMGDGMMNSMITLDVLANDHDPDGDPLSIVAITQPAQGGYAEARDGKLQYTPPPGFTGTVSLTYTASDAYGGADTATVTITVWQPVPLCADFDGTTNDVIRATVPGGTVTNGSVFCRVMVEDTEFIQPGREIGKLDVLQRGVTQAVDVFALYHDGRATAQFNNPITTCLRGSGAFLYLDATVAPRSIVELPVFRQNGYTCATLPNAGTIVLVEGDASVVTTAPSVPDATGPSVRLGDCMVTTRNMLNMRAMPSANSDLLRVLPYDVTLTALERAGQWFYVDYLGERGWISGFYVTPEGFCGQ